MNIPEFSCDIFNKTACKNLEAIINHYSWLKSVHCTSRYYDDDSIGLTKSFKNYFRFPQGENKGKEFNEETNMLGRASSLTIAGFIITPRTLGARVMLTNDQLTVYHQNDLEPFTVIPPPKNNSRGQPPPSQDIHSNIQTADTRSCEPTLRPMEDTEAGDIVGEVRGRRAHITLATGPGVRPVQTGLDQLDTLLAVSSGQVTGHQLGGGALHGAGQGRWVITLDTPLTVKTVYTGAY